MIVSGGIWKPMSMWYDTDNQSPCSSSQYDFVGTTFRQYMISTTNWLWRSYGICVFNFRGGCASHSGAWIAIFAWKLKRLSIWWERERAQIMGVGINGSYYILYCNPFTPTNNCYVCWNMSFKLYEHSIVIFLCNSISTITL